MWRHAVEEIPGLEDVVPSGVDADDDAPDDLARELTPMEIIRFTLFDLILLKENNHMSNRTLTALLQWVKPLSVLFCEHHLPGTSFAFPADWAAVDKMMTMEGMPKYEIYSVCYCSSTSFFLFRPGDKQKTCPQCAAGKSSGMHL